MAQFAVIGLGRFGLQIARGLASRGAEVIAIDKDKKLIEQIANDVAVAVRLDSTDEQALLAQGIEKVDCAIVGIGLDFQSNLLTTVLLKSIGVPKVCARAELHLHGQILRRVGADEIIFPKDESAQRWAFRLMAPQIGQKFSFAPGISLAQYTAPKIFNGKSLIDLDLRKKYALNLIGIHRQNLPTASAGVAHELIEIPNADTVINAGDLLWLVGTDKALGALPTDASGPEKKA